MLRTKLQLSTRGYRIILHPIALHLSSWWPTQGLGLVKQDHYLEVVLIIKSTAPAARCRVLYFFTPPRHYPTLWASPAQLRPQRHEDITPHSSRIPVALIFRTIDDVAGSVYGPVTLFPPETVCDSVFTTRDRLWLGVYQHTHWFLPIETACDSTKAPTLLQTRNHLIHLPWSHLTFDLTLTRNPPADPQRTLRR
jgi:hypothetical protein